MSDMLLRRARRVLFMRDNGASLQSGGAKLARSIDDVYESARDYVFDLRQAGPGQEPLDEARIERVLAQGRVAMTALLGANADVPLDPDQQAGLQAIIKATGRPSLRVRKDAVEQPIPSEWTRKMADAAAGLRTVLPSVGRINVMNEGERVGPSGFMGSGFMASNTLLMTNRHVASSFADVQAGDRGTFKHGFEAAVDFEAEADSAKSDPFRVKDIVLMHPHLDLALLELEPKSVGGKGTLPPPLQLGWPPDNVVPDEPVYVVGFPADADARQLKSITHAIFGDTLNVKQFAPGEVMKPNPSPGQFTHDCSTLEGNSGSCVVDFGSHWVVGLHFGGAVQEANYACLLDRGDPKFKPLALNFG
jgi:hypothetical protein